MMVTWTRKAAWWFNPTEQTNTECLLQLIPTVESLLCARCSRGCWLLSMLLLFTMRTSVLLMTPKMVSWNICPLRFLYNQERPWGKFWAVTHKQKSHRDFWASYGFPDKGIILSFFLLPSSWIGHEAGGGVAILLSWINKHQKESHTQRKAEKKVCRSLGHWHHPSLYNSSALLPAGLPDIQGKQTPTWWSRESWSFRTRGQTQV